MQQSEESEELPAAADCEQMPLLTTDFEQQMCCTVCPDARSAHSASLRVHWSSGFGREARSFVRCS